MYDVPKKVTMSTAEVKKVQVRIIETGPDDNKIKEEKEELKEPIMEEKVITELDEKPKDSLVKKLKKEWQLLLKVLQLVRLAKHLLDKN